ncbi:MAG TPA: HD domain-containing protein [Clostridiaceae bacterium]
MDKREYAEKKSALKKEDSLSVLNEAINFAVIAHLGAVRKGTNRPYILHPLEAAAIVSTMTDDKNLIAAAVLHDVVEDTEITIDDITENFGIDISGLVAAESEEKREYRPPGDTWKERKLETVEHLRSTASIEMKMITLGDKLSNIRAIHYDYQIHGDELWDRFNQNDKNEHGWYYKAILEATSDLQYYPAWKEFRQLVMLMFGE